MSEPYWSHSEIYLKSGVGDEASYLISRSFFENGEQGRSEQGLIVGRVLIKFGYVQSAGIFYFAG